MMRFTKRSRNAPPSKLLGAAGGVAACVLVAIPCSAFASDGCSEFRGGVNDQTKGEGGSRSGHRFSKGDILKVEIHQDPSRMKIGVNILEYAKPEGPFLAVTQDATESFTYTVPANTTDFLYLNFSGKYPGMIVTWGCAPSTEK